jgi:WD40 repeat protein
MNLTDDSLGLTKVRRPELAGAASLQQLGLFAQAASAYQAAMAASPSAYADGLVGLRAPTISVTSPRCLDLRDRMIGSVPGSSYPQITLPCSHEPGCVFEFTLGRPQDLTRYPFTTFLSAASLPFLLAAAVSDEVSQMTKLVMPQQQTVRVADLMRAASVLWLKALDKQMLFASAIAWRLSIWSCVSLVDTAGPQAHHEIQDVPQKSKRCSGASWRRRARCARPSASACSSRGRRRTSRASRAGFRSRPSSSTASRSATSSSPRTPRTSGWRSRSPCSRPSRARPTRPPSPACVDNSVKIVALGPERVVAEPGAHADACTDCHWASPNQLLTSARDRSVKVWDANMNRIVATIPAFSPVSLLCETGNPRLFAAACADGGIRIVDLREKGIVQTLDKLHKRPLTCVRYAPTEDMLYSMGLDAAIAATCLTGGARVRQLAHPELAVSEPTARFAIDPMGGFLAAGSASGAVVVLNLLGDGDARVLSHHKCPVLAIACAANLVVAADQKGNLSFWA